VKPGDVALVRFPFAELAAAKKRPALVLARTARSARNRLAVLAMITSQVESLRLEGDVLLSQWQAAGLLHPSLLRMAKVATVDEDLIEKTIGRLAPSDHDAARAAFRLVFSLWLR
jgi:mRNA interferase MazF